MTFEELKEMVNATINENGSGQITGKALNLAFIEFLNSVQEYIEENSSKGSGIEVIHIMDSLDENGMPVLTPEHQANNASVVAKFLEYAENKTTPPPVMIDLTNMMIIESAGAMPEDAKITASELIREVEFVSHPQIIDQFGSENVLLLRSEMINMLYILEDGSILMNN